MGLSVVVVGLGYVGLPLARAAVFSGHRVIGYDTSDSLVRRLGEGVSHILDVSSAELHEMLDLGFAASTDPVVFSGADVVVICVPTPLGIDGVPYLSFITSAAQSISKNISTGTTVILESTTFPGTTKEVVEPILAKSGLKVGQEIFLAFSPERIDPGNKQFGLTNTPKIVGADDARSLDKAVSFYRPFVPQIFETKGTKEAETAKLLENTYRQVNIALVNEFAKLCHELGIDVWDVIRAASTKPFGFETFHPGIGVGGHCIPIDPRYLSHKLKQVSGKDFEFIILAEKVNRQMPEYVSSRIATEYKAQKGLEIIAGDKFAILGVSYKPNSSDIRESPSVDLARELMSCGFDVHFIDSNVDVFEVDGVAVPRAQFEDLQGQRFEGAVVAQAHEEFLRTEQWSELAKKLFIFDATGRISGHGILRL